MAGKIDSFLEGVGSQLQSGEGRQALMGGCRRTMRRLTRWFTGAALVFLVLMFALMAWVGEGNVFFAYCLYVPPLLWFLPLGPALFLSALALDWKALLAGAAVIAGVCIWGLGWKMPPGLNRQAAPGQLTLKLLTNNRGQNAGQSLRPFMNLVQPDIMAFQESGGMANKYKSDPGYAAYPFAADAGDFTLLSKYPIVSVSIAPLPVPSDKPNTSPKTGWPDIAARFEIDVKGTHVAVYNVHTLSPRQSLAYYTRGAFLYGIIGLPGTPWAEKRRLCQRDWDVRTAEVEALLKTAREDSLPVILMGDFNMPSIGNLYRTVSSSFVDAHNAAGSGLGLTFPGETRNPLSLGGAWMRIDYIFLAGKEWEVLESVTEPRRTSQHRATFCRIALRHP